MKKVSLKLARRVEAALADIIGSRVNSLRNSVGVFDYAENALAEAEKRHSEVHREVVELVNLRYEIRSAISKENERSGINSLMCTTAHLEALSGTLKALNLPVSGEVKLPDSAFRNRETVTFKPALDKVITDLKFQISSVKDRVAGINAQSTIELDSSVVEVLNELGIPV